MCSYETYQEIQRLMREIFDLQEEILVLGPDHPDTPHLQELLEKSENELEYLDALDIVASW